MDMYNNDGSRGKMCGNGIRCVGKYVYDYGLTDKKQITVETLGGIKTLNLITENDKVVSVTVDMGSPDFKPENIPVKTDKEAMINEPVIVGDREYKVTCLSMGNPHAVVYVNDTDNLPLDKIGPLFENHEIFPDRVNTEFIQVIDRNHIKMRVWERGSGETLACGTGACASVVASVINGYTDTEVKVSLLGGDLLIKYDKTSNIVYMTGPAVTVFEGEINL